LANQDEDRRDVAGGEVLLPLTANIVAAFARNNSLTPQELTDLIRTVHTALSALPDSGQNRLPEKPTPAAPIAKSVQHDHIVCLEDGKKLKMLKRYLRTTYGMSPEEYRKRWSLPADYPMVAPAYAARRSEFAKKIGLGRGVRRRDGKDE
jgi:predicted transcriptional regulator